MGKFRSNQISNPNHYPILILFSYRQGKPCFLLKMNKIYDFKPLPYTYDQVKNHTTMPEKLKLHIDKVWQEKCDGYTSSGYSAEGEYRPCPWLNMAWLHCDGENAADIENIGPVSVDNFYSGCHIVQLT